MEPGGIDRGPANAVVLPEVVVFQPPVDQTAQARDFLTKTVPKARIIPNRVVMSTSGAQYDRWKQATSQELQAFLKTAWKEPTPEVRSRYFASKKKVVMQLLVFSLKPKTAEKKPQGLVGDEYEKTRICLQGQNHEGFQVQNSSTNADAHLLRLFSTVQANPKNVFASFDVSNAFLNAELFEDVITLTQPAPELIQFGLVKRGSLYQCTKACYGLREAPKPWEEARDKTLTSLSSRLIMMSSDSIYHPSLWFVVRAPHQSMSKKVRLPDLADISVFGEHEHVAGFLVYVDDDLAAELREILQPLLTRLLDVWKGSNPNYLGRQPGDVDTMRFLGLDLELGPEEGTWLLHCGCPCEPGQIFYRWWLALPHLQLHMKLVLVPNTYTLLCSMNRSRI